MEKKNKIILAIIAVVAIVAIVIAAIVTAKPEDSKSSIVDNNKEVTQKAEVKSETEKTVEKKAENKVEKKAEKTEVTPEPEKVTPTFVYFVTKEDATTDAFLATVEKLKTEFSGKVNFDLRDLDANPQEKENFALVVGNTPAVIMLDIYNNPCAFELANPSEDALRATIKKALGE